MNPGKIQKNNNKSEDNEQKHQKERTKPKWLANETKPPCPPFLQEERPFFYSR